MTAAPHTRLDLSSPWPDVEEVLSPATLEQLAALAPGLDSGTDSVAASLRVLKEAGWPGFVIPEMFCGAGAGMTQACSGQLALGRADPALAIAVNMHVFSVGLMVEYWRQEGDTSWLLMEAIATQNRILASAFAEPGLAGSTKRSGIRAQRTEAGWEVSGRKRPCSLAAEADLVCIQVETDQDPPELLVMLLPTSAAGLRVERSWDTIGMRGSASNTLVLDRCVIPDDLVFYRAPAGQSSDELLAAGVIWFCLTSTCAYLGLADRAIAEAGSLLSRTRVEQLGAERAHLPSYQAAIGDAIADVVALNSAALGLARRVDARRKGGAQDLLPEVVAVKQTAVRVVPALMSALASSLGGVAYGNGQAFGRLWRDALAINFHPPTTVASRQYLAQLALGLEADLDLTETPNAKGDPQKEER